MTESIQVSTEDYLSPPVLRAAQLLRHIAEGATVSNMARTARELKINRTTLLRLLHTLESERFIEFQGEGRGWRIGIGLISLTAEAFFSEDLVQVAVPVLAKLAEALDLSTHLGVLDRHEVVYLVRRVPNHSFVSNIRAGSRLPAHATVIGRIILAHMPVAVVDQMYEGVQLQAATAHTPVTLPDLRKQLHEDRLAGLAWSDGFYDDGISSVASAIFEARGIPVGAINATGQEKSFSSVDRRRLISDEVIRGADEISRRLGWVGVRSHATNAIMAGKVA